jgi:hypothetical protein
MMSPFSDVDFLDSLPLGGDANAGAGNWYEASGS